MSLVFILALGWEFLLEEGMMVSLLQADVPDFLQERWEFIIGSCIFVGISLILLRNEFRKRHQTYLILEGQTRVLELVTQGRPMRETLDVLAEVIESQLKGVRVSIYLWDETRKHFRLISAPNLPESFTRFFGSIDKVLALGASGRTNYVNESVIVEDIETDPYWAAAKHLPLSLGLRACYSKPFTGSQGKVLGTFCLYYNQARKPTEYERPIIYSTAYLAGVAVERKLAEEELSNYKNRLEDLVVQRTSGLKKAIACLKREIRVRQRAEKELKASQCRLIHCEKLSSSGKLIASIAHEINNPIYGIRNVLVKIGRKVPMDEKYIGFNQLAIKECDRVANLIRKLQDFHRPSSEKRELLDLQETIEEILWLLEKSLGVKKIKLEKHYVPDLPKVKAVKDQIKQVILNLLQNAENAIPKSGGEIILRTENGGAQIKFHVQDTGCGIPPENRIEIFEPFFTTKKGMKGNGLGLSVSYGIVRAHGGEIQVNSEPGRGSTFTVTLPISGDVK
ncbi:MAG: ATP-binding protein [Nitrospinaceae bacterium]